MFFSTPLRRASCVDLHDQLLSPASTANPDSKAEQEARTSIATPSYVCRKPQLHCSFHTHTYAHTYTSTHTHARACAFVHRALSVFLCVHLLILVSHVHLGGCGISRSGRTSCARRSGIVCVLPHPLGRRLVAFPICLRYRRIVFLALTLFIDKK